MIMISNDDDDKCIGSLTSGECARRRIYCLTCGLLWVTTYKMKLINQLP